MNSTEHSSVNSTGPADLRIELAERLLREGLGPLAALSDRYRELPAGIGPMLEGAPLRRARQWLFEHCASPLVRADVLALVTRGYSTAEVAAADHSRESLLKCASGLSIPAAVGLMTRWPHAELDADWVSSDANWVARRQEEASLLQLFAEEQGCFDETLQSWLTEEVLERYCGDDRDMRTRLLNTMRWVRLHEDIQSPWMAELYFPRLLRAQTGARLYWTVGAPLTIGRVEALVEVDVVISADDMLKVRNAADRRRQLTDKVKSYLRQGQSVACVANHSTQEARYSILKVARDMGAPSIALYYDFEEATIEALNAEAGWNVSRRTVERVLDTLEAPRPHEAEEVWVMGPQGRRARWIATASTTGGFEEVLDAPAAASADVSEPV